MKVAQMYATGDVKDVAQDYAESQPKRFVKMTLNDAVRRPYGGGDGTWEFGGSATIWHSPDKPSPVTVLVTITSGSVTEVTHIWG